MTSKILLLKSDHGHAPNFASIVLEGLKDAFWHFCERLAKNPVNVLFYFFYLIGGFRGTLRFPHTTTVSIMVEGNRVVHEETHDRT